MSDPLSFSQRMGLKPVRSRIQVDSMDSELRTGLWNVLTRHCWDHLDSPPTNDPFDIDRNRGQIFFTRVWLNFFKESLDVLKKMSNSSIHNMIRHRFFDWEWNEVYDFVEFALNNFPFNRHEQQLFVAACNTRLSRERSGFRFINNVLTPVTSREELKSIQEALAVPDKFQPVRAHLERGLELLSDRKSPDYRNSIKESISAVESVCKLLTGDEKATLTGGLNRLSQQVDLHHALRTAFIKLYGYTSDAEGIRHALLEESNLTFDDAKFMLVSCSAFVNYLISRVKG